MSETRGRRSGGRAARQAARAHAHVERVPFLTRTLAPFEVLSEEGLTTLEENADRILEEVGIEFHDAPDALGLFLEAGADVQGERVRFPRGLCRSLVPEVLPDGSRCGDYAFRIRSDTMPSREKALRESTISFAASATSR